MDQTWDGHVVSRNRATAIEEDEDDEDLHGDDGPLLNYKYEKYRRYASYAAESRTQDKGRRSTLGVVVKFSVFCTAMILFCVLMYIPMYNRVIDHIPKDVVAGWTVHTNRDTKIYVQPHNTTTLHEPRKLCSKHDKTKKRFLLIVVCSSTENFERRIAIRETWGSYKNYLELTKLYATVKESYKNYNYSYDLYPEQTVLSVNSTDNVNRTKREVGISQLLPRLAEALKRNLENIKTETVTEEKRFEDENEKLPEFDMNKEFDNSNQLANYDYDYETNVMKIPPNGYDDSPDLKKVMYLLKKSKSMIENGRHSTEKVILDDEDLDLDFKLTFLLGVPPQENNTEIQSKIDEEVEKYDDVIQENFIDSYNNLTLKSIMMLKWVTHHCSDNLRYILKTDDDMYINVPNLVSTLRNRSREYEIKVARGWKEKEYLLIGDLVSGAKPVLDATNKWFSPRYMYGGRVYPRYLSGPGYALSVPAAGALYQAALDTPYFHLEDVFITGMCALRARARVRPAAAAGFLARAGRGGACGALAHVCVHRVTPACMRSVHAQLLRPDLLDKCERIRLTQVRRDRLRPKLPPKKQLTKLGKSMTK